MWVDDAKRIFREAFRRGGIAERVMDSWLGLRIVAAGCVFLLVFAHMATNGWIWIVFVPVFFYISAIAFLMALNLSPLDSISGGSPMSPVTALAVISFVGAFWVAVLMYITSSIWVSIGVLSILPVIISRIYSFRTNRVIPAKNVFLGTSILVSIGGVSAIFIR